MTGSVFVSGSNPHADYAVDDVKFPTEYRVEIFYPEYYNERRPEPEGILSTLSYGGPYFNVSLTKDDLSGDVNNLKNTKVIVYRTGFSTHTMVSAEAYRCAAEDPRADTSLRRTEHGHAHARARHVLLRQVGRQRNPARQPDAPQPCHLPSRPCS